MRILKVAGVLALLEVACVALVLTLGASPLHGATPAPGATLKAGSSGQRVSDLQWLLSGKKPSAYRGISAFGQKPNGYFGPRTAEAVKRMKYRLGYPDAYVRAYAGPLLFDYLLGKKKRPLAYIVRASKRVSAPMPTSDACSQRIASAARYELSLGVREIPDGSNRSSHISKYQAVTHGSYGVAWCVSFAQYILVKAGLGTIADRTAGVFYAVNWARNRGLVNARPKVGSLVAFMNLQGHMGVVVKVTSHGFVTIEGNTSNAVRERFHTIGARPAVFIYPPDCR